MTDDQREDLMTSLAKTLGTATNGEGPDLSPAAKQRLIADAASGEVVMADGVTYRKFWAVGKLLDYGEGYLGGDFLADVSAEIYDNRVSLRQMADHPFGDEGMISSADSKYSSDPMLVALEAMDHSPEASRDFFNHEAGGELDRLQTLMEEYSRRQDPWEYLPGQEGVLMDAITTATTEFNEVDPQRGTDAYREAGNIASHFLHYAAEEERDMGMLPQATDRAVSSVLAFYYEDLHATLIPQDHFDGVGAREGELPYSALGFRYGAEISEADAAALLGEVWGDDVSRGRILGAAAVYAEADLRARPAEIESVFNDYGKDVGRLMSAAYGNKIDNAMETQDVKDAAALLFNVTAGAIGPEGQTAKLAYEGFKQVAGGALDNMGSSVDDLRGQFAAEIGNARNSIQYTAAEMIMRNDLWTDEDSGFRDEWWDDAKGQFNIPPKDTQAREDFDTWIDQRASEGDLPPVEAFTTGLEAGSVEKYPG